MRSTFRIPYTGIVALFALIAIIAFSIVGCEKPAAPVQNTPTSIGDRTLPPLPKTTATFLFRLNPTADPFGGCTNWYSSGGYNQPAAWVSHTFNLSAYAHHRVQIRFSFNTRDGLYNKFEGWYLDDIHIGSFFDDVEAGPNGWIAVNAQSQPIWRISDHRSYSSSHAWWYGRDDQLTYRGGSPPYYGDCSDQTNSGILISPIVCLGANPALSFKTWWVIEGVNSANFDLMDIEIQDLGAVPVPMDIHPASCPNPLNVNSKGVLPVALCGSACLDFSLMDLTTIKLEGVAPIRGDWEDVSRPRGHKPVDCNDCNTDGPDGLLDYSMKFDTPKIVAAIGPVTDGECKLLTLTGKYLDGTDFASHDYVKIIKKK